MTEKEYTPSPFLEQPKPTRDDVTVGSWSERDRLGIWLVDKRNQQTVTEWWDDNARQMFDDGFFKPATYSAAGTLGGPEFIDSVLDYAESVGILAKEGNPGNQEVQIERYQGIIVGVGGTPTKTLNLPDWDLSYVEFPEGKMKEYRTAMIKARVRIVKVTKERVYYSES